MPYYQDSLNNWVHKGATELLLPRAVRLIQASAVPVPLAAAALWILLCPQFIHPSAIVFNCGQSHPLLVLLVSSVAQLKASRLVCFHPFSKD